jgi:hypothetical protein
MLFVEATQIKGGIILWGMTDSGIEKMMVLRDVEDHIKGFLLPQGISMEMVRVWTDRFMKNAMDRNEMQQRRLERFEGRTFREDWAKPLRYANITGNTPNGDFDIGVRILDLIETEGRQDINELHRELAAVDKEPFSIIVNMLRKDRYLKDYTEHSGFHSLELLERKERNELLGLPAPEPKKKIVMPCLAYVRSKDEDTRDIGQDLKI